MPYNGSGTYAPSGADFPVTTLTVIASAKYNNVVNDQSTAMSNAVTRDGQSPWTANMPGGGFKITNLAAGTLRSDSARPAEVQDGTYIWGGTAGGTGDALTLTLSPAITAYVAGQRFVFKSSASANTTAATVAVSGLATKAIQLNGLALIANDIVASQWYEILYDGAAFQLFRIGINVGSEFTTGDVKITIKTAADVGWVLMNDGTIGNAASGATTRANADTVGLYTLLYNNTVDGDCAVSTGRGVSAAADYAANKTIALPKALGRALATFGTGAALTARTMGAKLGAETLPAHTHTGTTTSDGAHTHNGIAGSTAGGSNFVAQTDQNARTYVTSSDGAHTHTFTSDSTGTGTHGVMQPTLFLNVMIKL